MLESAETIFRIVLRTGFRILLSFLFIMSFTIFLNWTFVALYPWIGKNIYFEFWPMFLGILAIFGLLIPYVYYLTTLRFLPQIALSKLYEANTRLIFEYPVHRFFEQQETLTADEFIQKLQSKSLGGRTIRWVYAFLIKKTSWSSTILAISTEVPLKRENAIQIIDRLEAKKDELLPLKFLKAGYGWFYFYLLLNVVLMGITVFFI